MKYGNDNETKQNYTFSDLEYLYSADWADVKIEIEEKQDRKKCVLNLVDSCPGNCPNIVWETLCKAYQSVVQYNNSGKFLSYRNKYCLFCNIGEETEDFRCYESEEINTDILLNTYKYNFLFEEIRRKKKMKEEELKKSIINCENNHFYIQKENKCRELIDKNSLYDLLNPSICSFNLHFKIKFYNNSENITNIDLYLQNRLIDLSSNLNNFKFTLKPVMSMDLCNGVMVKEYLNDSNGMTINCTSFLIVSKEFNGCNNNNIKLKKVENETGQFSMETFEFQELDDKMRIYSIITGQMCENYISFGEEKPEFLSKSLNYFVKNNTNYYCESEFTTSPVTEFENKKSLDSDKIDAIGLFGLICNCLSLTALIIRLILPCFLPKLRTKGMWIQWHLAFAIFIWQLSVLLSPLLTFSAWVCRSIAVLGHLSMISSISWQSILAIDMFFKFREKSMLDSTKFSELKVWKYFLMAWGLPLAPVITCIILAITKPDDVVYGIDKAKDEYSKRCWIYGFFGQIVLLIIPILLLLLINTTILVTTIRNLHTMLKKSPASSKTPMKKQLILFAKLSILFGISWFAMFISAYVDHDSLTIINIISNVSIGVWLSATSLVSRDIWKRKLSGSETYLSGRQSKK